MLRLPPFKLHVAQSLADATAVLAGEGASEAATAGAPVRVVAGGTDLWPNLKRRHQKASTVISLGRLGELKGIELGSGDREARLGALATLAEITRHRELAARYPALVRAVTSISTPVLRNMGTIGGNLCLDTRCTYYNQNEEWRRAIDYCMKEAGKVCWVAPGSARCWAISASDSAPILCALGARVRLAAHDGERVIPASDLFADDGIAYLGKRPEEVLTEVLLPASAAAPGLRSAFWKLRRRGSIDFAVLSVGAAVELDAAGVVTAARVFLGAVASFPTPAQATAEALIGKPLTAEAIAAAAALARREATPMDNTDFLAPWRGQMVTKYVEAALRECAGLPQERLSPRHGIAA